jgi:hypothetical protein
MSGDVTPRRGKRALRRLGAIALGLFVALLLLEAGLQVASLFARPVSRRVPPVGPEERRIVCIGDSFTYGVHLPAAASYPSQLQGMLDRVPGQPWRVFNLGYPGQNSAQVRAGLARNLAAYRPEIVVVLIGTNNSWSPAESHLWSHPDSEPAASPLVALVQHSRALGAVSMLWQRIRSRRIKDKVVLQAGREVPGVDGIERGAGVVPVEFLEFRGQRNTQTLMRRSLAIDFARMRQIAAEQGATLVLADYPVTLQSTHEVLNPFIREAAAACGAPLVPLEREMVPLEAELGHQTIWLADHHCSAAGNYEVARLVLRTLLEQGLIEDHESWRTVRPVRELPLMNGVHVVEHVGDELVVELFGIPDDLFRIGLRAVFTRPGSAEPVALQLPLTHLDYTDAERERWFGRFDPVGFARTRLRLPRFVSTTSPGPPLDGLLPGDAELQGWRLVVHLRPKGSAPRGAQTLPALDVPLVAPAAVVEPAAR